MQATNNDFLVSRYYAWEKITLSTSILMIIYSFWELVNFRLPLIDFQLYDQTKLPIIIGITLVISNFFLIIEWNQSSDIARKSRLSRLRFIIILALSGFAYWKIIPTLTRGTAVGAVPQIWYLVFVIFGVFIGFSFSMLILASLLIRSSEESKRLELPRIPILTLTEYILYIPILIVLLTTYFF